MEKKKNQLNGLYCNLGLVDYYSFLTKNLSEKPQQPYTENTEKYCNNNNQIDYKMYKDYYLRHQTS